MPFYILSLARFLGPSMVILIFCIKLLIPIAALLSLLFFFPVLLLFITYRLPPVTTLTSVFLIISPGRHFKELRMIKSAIPPLLNNISGFLFSFRWFPPFVVCHNTRYSFEYWLNNVCLNLLHISIRCFNSKSYPLAFTFLSAHHSSYSTLGAACSL